MQDKWIVGVDIGGTTTKLAFINMDGEILYKWQIYTDNSNEGKNITINIAKSIAINLAKLKLNKQNLLGIGIGAPGPVNYQTGVILNAVNLGWSDSFPLKDLLERETDLPVYIDNDANCAALGEMWKGAGNGAKDIVFVTIGTGIGGGIIINGEIVQGINGAGGEIGHITAMPINGSQCNCGKTGCIETIASATGIVRLAKEELLTIGTPGELHNILTKEGKITAKDVMVCAQKGDMIAKKVLNYVTFYLGFVLAGIANTLNPEKIVIGGGVSKAGKILINPLKEQFAQFTFKPVRESTEIIVATLGNDAGVIGAAWLVRKAFL
ncbi:MAG TPA: ROK family glucokinase [Bacillales bacterium]|nr:ROK family glucokinase [Bacillales bacterium]